jgi:spore coat protein U-like protein
VTHPKAAPFARLKGPTFGGALGGLCAALLLGAGSAHAVKPTFGCSVATLPLAFGPYNPLAAAPAQMETSIFIDCASSVKFVSLTLDSGPSTKPALRQMRSGSYTLDYAIYRDVQRTVLWRNGETLPTVTLPQRGDLTLWLYGTVPARQNAVPSDYSDVLTLTVVTP